MGETRQKCDATFAKMVGVVETLGGIIMNMADIEQLLEDLEVKTQRLDPMRLADKARDLYRDTLATDLGQLGCQFAPDEMLTELSYRAAAAQLPPAD